MVISSDFLALSYSSDLTQAGIAYGLRSLPYFHLQEGEGVAQHLRQIVASKGVELAFKRYLAAQDIPHKVWGRASFANPGDSDLELGGRECVLRTELISEKNLIQKVHQNPEGLLSAHVAVPSEQVPPLLHMRNKIYIFAYLTALITPTRERVEQALEAEQKVYFIHNLPAEEFAPSQCESLGEISLKCDTSAPVVLTLGGQNIKREFQSVRVTLAPRTRFVVQEKFCSLSYVRVEELPDGALGIHSSVVGSPYLISPRQWVNIWVYGMKIFFVGYLPGESFAQKGQRLLPGNRLFSGRKALVENLVFPVDELHPLQGLFDRTREWARGV